MPREILNGVLGLAFNDKHQVLLSQRFQPETPEAHLKWQIPGGGQEYGEHMLETLKREMMEELGVKCDVLDERPLIYTSFWDKGKPGELQVNLIIYVISIGKQIPKIEDVETNDWMWVDIDEVAALPLLPQTNEIVRHAYEIFLKKKS